VSHQRERLARMDDDELLALPHEAADHGWGAAGTSAVDGVPVFVKRLPLTDVELAHPRSTKNWFRLPTYYAYPMGSAGFGSWREVAAHEALAGVDGVPELLHWRVLPRASSPTEQPSTSDRYVAYWNGSRAIGRFMAARAAATHEVWMVLEHLPLLAGPCVLDDPAVIDDVLAAMLGTLDRLHEQGIWHFDVHLRNVVGDGATWRLTDLGLSNSHDFELGVAERRFLDRHRWFDHAILLGTLVALLSDAIAQGPRLRPVTAILDGSDDGPLLAVLRRYRGPVLYMADWFDRMRRPTKRSTYDDTEMRDLLRAAGVPT
jgi:hypothetical protein